MIQFSKEIKPFISLQNCGDFSIYLDCKNSYLFCIGDIGGHGNINIRKLSLEIEKLIESNKEKNTFELFELISNTKKVKDYGLTMFIGRVDKKLPMLQYICIGNLKLNIVRNNEIKPLKKQNGVIGLELPVHIEQNIFKLKDKDLIIISTDGVNNYEHSIFNNIDFSKSIEDIASSIINIYGLKDDDALTSIIYYKNSSNNVIKNDLKKDLTVKQTIQKSISPILPIESINQSNILIKPLITHKSILDVLENITLLNKEYFFASINNSLLARSKIKTIASYLNLEKFFSIKLQTIIMELLQKDIVHIDIYVSSNTFQIQTPLHKKNVQKIIPLLNNCRFCYEEKSLLFTMEFSLSNMIDIKSKEHLEIKEMLFFGLDKENYEVYKKEKEKTTLMSRQSKLASMGEMIGAIAHQWRQPLNELAIKIQKLKYNYNKNKIDEEYIENYVKTSIKTIKFMSQTIDDFRGFFRISKVKQLFDVKDSLIEVLSMQKAQLDNHFIKTKIYGNTFSYNGFKNEFQQVLLNIISNAKDACVKNNNKEPLVTFNIVDNKIIITDNGGGIEEDIKDRIFEPYFTTKDQGEGTGMGLYMCKMIIEDNMHGKIYAENTTSGTKITIEL